MFDFRVLIASLALVAAAIPAHAQDPWPLERQDRYGTGHAVFGPDPATLTTPWISNRLANFPVSHGASIREDGVGFFGDWVDNKVFKFDTSNGTILGAFQALSFVHGVPAIGPSGTITVNTEGTDGKIYGLDTGIMDFNWFSTTGYVGGSPNIGPEGDVVYGIGAGTVFRRSSLGGSLVWSHPGLGAVNGTVVFTRDDAKVIVSEGSSITALNWSDGSLAWSVNYGTTMGSPAVAPNGTIVVGSVSGTFYGLNPLNGAVLWTWGTLDKALGAPAFSPDGTVAYCPSVDFRVYAIRVSDGHRLWSFTTSLWCEFAPVVDTEGRIYVHNKAGDLYCISPAGAQIWQVHLNGEARGPMTIGPDDTLYVGYTGDNNRGLAIIRQHGLSYQPTALNMFRGSIIAGGLADTFVSDNSRVVFKKGPVASSGERPIQAIFTLSSPYKPLTQISVKVESKSNCPSLGRWLELYNNSTGNWDKIASGAESQTDTVISATVTNAAPYTAGNGDVKLRVGWKEIGLVPFSNWQTAIDYLHFDVIPQFVG